MTCSAPTMGRTSTNTGTDQTPPSMGRSCPEDEAYIDQLWQEAKDAGQPVSRRFIRQKLMNGQTDWDFGGHVLTYLTRQGSRPVDRAVGERVVRRLAGRQAHPRLPLAEGEAAEANPAAPVGNPPSTGAAATPKENPMNDPTRNARANTGMTVADLGVRHLGLTVRVNGYQGPLHLITLTDHADCVELHIGESLTWVKPSAPAEIIP